MKNTGLVIFFTGLSGSGKTTLAEKVKEFIEIKKNCPVTLLDGDVVRTLLCSKLGFSKEDRNLNIKRIGFVAAEIAKHGGVAICSPIAPYDNIRKEVRKMVEDNNNKFILVYLSTPLEECERRDVKGLYKKVRKGEILNFTGINDPYEPPKDFDLVLDTTIEDITQSLNKILYKLGM
jgi:sulfate adenylyltransferase